MNIKFWRLLIVMMATVAVFMLSCADDDDDPPPAPTPAQRLAGYWDARQAAEDTLGLDSLAYRFTSTGGFELYQNVIFGSPPDTITIAGSGTFTATASTITFHQTFWNGATVDSTYNRAYSLSSDDNVLTLEYRQDGSAWNFVYDRVP